MIFVFEVISPALPSGGPPSDLHQDSWSFQDSSLAAATERAQVRLESTFALASRERVENTTIRFVAEYPSMQAYRAAREAA